MKSATEEATDDLGRALRHAGFAGFEAFVSARTPEAQIGVCYTSDLPSDAISAPDARQAVLPLRQMLSGADGLPIVIDLARSVADADDAEVVAFIERVRAAGFAQAVLLAFAANERDAFCLAYAVTPVVDDSALARSFAAAHRHFRAVHHARPRLPSSGGAAYAERFSAREREVLGWCAKGKSNWEIARILAISENTVRFHIKNAFRKLDASSRGAAINAALTRGVIRPALTGRKERLVEMYRSFVEGDARPFRAMLADDVVLIATAPSELFDQGGRYEGPDAVLDHATRVARSFDCRRFLPRVIIEDGDDVAVYLDVELVHRPSGNAMLFDCAHFWTFRNDKIVHFVELFNTAAAHRQMLGEPTSIVQPRPTCPQQH